MPTVSGSTGREKDSNRDETVMKGEGAEVRCAKVLEKYGGGGGCRTPDPRLMSPLLYHLSYTAMVRKIA